MKIDLELLGSAIQKLKISMVINHKEKELIVELLEKAHRQETRVQVVEKVKRQFANKG